MTSTQIPTIESHEVTQLSKVYSETSIKLKNQQLYISYFEKGIKKKSPTFSSFDDFLHFYKTNGVIPSKLSLSTILGLGFDSSGNHLVLFRCYIKQAMRIHCLQGDTAWDFPLSDECEKIMIIGIQC